MVLPLWMTFCKFLTKLVQSLSHVWLFATPWTAAQQASLSFTIFLSFLKLMSIELVMPSNPILTSIIPFSSCLWFFPESVSFLVSQLFTSGGQSIGVSASALVLLMNIQDWFPLELTGLISLLSKGPSRVFSNTTVQNIHYSALNLLYGPTLTSIHDYRRNHSLD